MTAPAAYTIPLRTPFTLTGSATDADDDSLLYSWEQNDRGGAAGTTLLSNTKTNGPLFAMFPKSGQISRERHAALQLAGREPPDERSEPRRSRISSRSSTTTRTPTPARARQMPPIAPPVPQAVTECFAEFLPTSDYVGFAGTNASPPRLRLPLHRP